MEKKTKDLQKEIELLNGKIKGAAGDKTRICGILDAKVSLLDMLRFKSFGFTWLLLFVVSRA